jgi:hypothetical protein
MLFYGTVPKYMCFLKTFGEVGVVLDQHTHNIKGKLENCGKTCMFTGYAEDHAGDVYHMLNLETNCGLKTCDILWLNKVYGTYNLYRRWSHPSYPSHGH